MVRHNPRDLYSGVAMGLALIRANKVELGIDQLRRVVQTHPDRVEAWDGLLTGLDESGQVDLMEQELERLPAALSEAPVYSSIGPGSPRMRIAGMRPSTSSAEHVRKSPTTASSSTVLAEPCDMWARRPRPVESKSAFTAARRLYRTCAGCSTRLQRPGPGNHVRTRSFTSGSPCAGSACSCPRRPTPGINSYWGMTPRTKSVSPPLPGWGIRAAHHDRR